MGYRSFRFSIPASTSNIGPGFDTLGLGLRLRNFYDISENKEGKHRVEYTSPFDEKITPEEDLFLKAYIRTSEKLKVKTYGIDARIANRIPAGAGLGSSAVAILGGVLSAFLLSGKEYRKEDILDIALELEGHPDNITPSLFGGFTVSSVISGKVFFKRFVIDRKLKAVVAIPDFKLKTQKARGVLPKKLSFKDAAFNINRTAFLVSAFAKKELQGIQWTFYDRVHQPSRSKLVPGLNEIIEVANSAGAIGCFLSGAGPSIVALCSNNAEKIGKLIVNIWKKHRISSKMIVTGIDNIGLKIIK